MKAPQASLEQWRVLQAVVDCGGYAQAAERLHRSQSSVSYTVARLQAQIGMEVLQIEGRRARLTEAGEMLLRRARQLLHEASELEAVAARLKQGWEPEIDLVVDAAFPTDLLMEILKDFASVSRGSRVRLHEVVLSGADEALETGQADLVIGAQVPSGFLGDELLAIEFVAVAHPKHRLHGLRREISTHDLRSELQVVIRDSGHSRQRDVGWLGAEHRWTVSNIETAVTLVAKGLGFGWLPRHHIAGRLSTGSLKPLPLREGGTRRHFLYLIFGRPQDVGPATHELARIVRKTAAPETWGATALEMRTPSENV